MEARPHYYLLKNKIILRLEAEESKQALPQWVLQNFLDTEAVPLNQEQANFRVAIFRDEIIELAEYQSRFSKPVSNA